MTIPNEINNLDYQEDQNVSFQNASREGPSAPPKTIMVCDLESLSGFVKDLKNCDQNFMIKTTGRWIKVFANSLDNKYKIVEFLKDKPKETKVFADSLDIKYKIVQFLKDKYEFLSFLT